MKNYTAKIRLNDRSNRIAASIYHALAPDLVTMPSSDSRTNLSLKETHVIIDIESSDIASLRASLNSFLRLADASYKCLTV